LFTSDAEVITEVREIKRRYPLLSILMLTENSDSNYQDDLVTAGADFVLMPGDSQMNVDRAMILSLRQSQQRRNLAQRNRKLYEITLLARHLHSNTDPEALIAETIDLVCSTFRLDGMAVALSEADSLHFYAGQAGAVKNDNLYQSRVHVQDYEPFQRVITSSIVQIFDDISSDIHFVPFPSLQASASAIILPLRYQNDNWGAMAFFRSAEQPFSLDDLFIFETLAAQFIVALQNTYYNYKQHINVQFSRTLLRAWQQFIVLDDVGTIADVLCDTIDSLDRVKYSLVWLNENALGEQSELIVRSQRDEAVRVFNELYESGEIDKLIEQMGADVNVLFRFGRSPKDTLLPLFATLGGHQLIVLPVTDSARLIGGIIASITSSDLFGVEYSDLLKSLTYAAGQALERLTLISHTLEKSGRLEAIVRSISEGIFFVDETGQVAFCNPQFSELTQINPSEVMGQPVEHLLTLLAQQAMDPDRIHEQLLVASQDVNNVHVVEGDYPIVQFAFAESKQRAHIEFVRVSGMSQQDNRWAGVIRSSMHNRVPPPPALPLNQIIDVVHRDEGEIQRIARSLLKDTSSPQKREYARRLRDYSTRIEAMWDDFIKLYQVESQSTTPEPDTIFVRDLLQYVAKKRLSPEYHKSIKLINSERISPLMINREMAEEGLTHLVSAVAEISPKEGSLVLSVEEHDDEVFLRLLCKDLRINPEDAERFLEPFFTINEISTNLRVFLGRRLIEVAGGRVWVETGKDGQVTITSAMPADPNAQETAAAQRLEVTPNDRERSGAPVRAPEKIMVVEAGSQLVDELVNLLEDEGYLTLTYRSTDEALRDLDLTRLDLIVIDDALTDMNSLELCERMRARTEVPIVIVGNSASSKQRVRALELGAEDYISGPISHEELMARINVIFNRPHLANRTREPLDLGDLRIDFARREVHVHNQLVELTRIEYDLLYTLVSNMNQVLTHSQLLEKVWGPEHRSETQYLWVHVSRIRKKLEPTTYIKNQQGIGYTFQV
jgi:DNA-binding response OmpR family regulator/PAS domain-containing protein